MSVRLVPGKNPRDLSWVRRIYFDKYKPLGLEPVADRPDLWDMVFPLHEDSAAWIRHLSKDPAKETAYFRHSAFIARFQRFANDWYLEITPTYHFTSDGYREDRFAGEHLKKIKELENNGAVMGQFVMWRFYLMDRTSSDMFAGEYPFLKFGLAKDFSVEWGVPDKLWQSQEPAQRSTLFDQVPSD